MQLPKLPCTRGLLAAAVLLSLFTIPSQATQRNWTGGGLDDKWSTANNWGGTAPSAGDALNFTGTLRLTPTNDFAAGTTFSQITFTTPAAAFNLIGNGIMLGSITDTQPILTETVNLPLTLSVNGIFSAPPSGTLAINKPVGGPFSLTLTGGGQVNLAATNTFSGGLLVNAGTSSQIATDLNLGAVPGSVTPGNIILNGGTLKTTNNVAVNVNRGIYLGPAVGSGTGAFDVGAGVTVTYNGTLANNPGGTGGLNKVSFGGLTLGGSNTYSGATAIENGTMTLDFSQASAPGTNIINPVSSLSLGGTTSGLGTTNYAALVVNTKASTTNAQTFASTFVNIGQSFIKVNSNNLAGGNVSLGLLTHVPGGVVNIITPKLAGTGGNITTTATNFNGIIGPWVTVSDGTIAGGNQPSIPTNWASVDGSGNIVNFTNYTFYASGNLSTIMFATNNIMINNTTGGTGDVTVDVDHNPGSGTTNDVNTISINRPAGAWSLRIGSNNVVRLGKSGAIFVQDTAAAPGTWEIGNSTGGANTAADQNVGILTAGGPTNNSPGELIVYRNEPGSGSAGQMAIDAQITDNGTGPVTLVKGGPGYLKLRGHNTYSGGTYFLQGRIQLSGAEVGTVNPDACGTGPCYVFPGCYLYLNPAAANTFFTNTLYIAGSGTQQEALGVIRFQNTGWVVSGTVNLIGDATIGGNNGQVSGQITGPFNLTLGSGATVSGSLILSNSANNWNGNTIMQNRSGASSSLANAANEVIPNGLGFGNVIMSGFSGGTYTWDLSGFNETINGLSTIGTGPSCIITSSAATSNSVLTVGDNDQSGTFAGSITGTLSLVKIRAGLETLTGTNTYSGTTTVIGTNGAGTLALSAGGSIPNSSPISVQNAGTLDVSGLALGFTATNTVALSNGTLAANAVACSIPSLNMTNSGLTLSVNTVGVNVTTSTLTTGGTTNLINIANVQGVTGYPAKFNLIKYSGAIGGAGNNFGIGAVPNAQTVGYVSNDVANTTIELVLLNGPKPLTWVGTDATTPGVWDTGTNWIGFKGFPGQSADVFGTADQVLFDDTGSTNIVTKNGVVVPGGMTISNSVLNYFFVGPGLISGTGGLLKQGTASATFMNTGVDNWQGGVTLSAGTLVFGTDNAIGGGVNIGVGTTLQVGTNGGTGTLPGGNVDLEGNLILNRGANFTVGNVISGVSAAAKITKQASDTVTLSGANTFTGAVEVVAGTLQTSSGSALGSTNGATTIDAGATLDVNGQALGFEPIIVKGAGVGNNGAIVNSGAGQNNALRTVTLTGDTTFGGAGRWDIRESTANTQNASLSTGGNAYNLTKVSTNQVSLVGVAVDSQLNNITVNGGLLGFELDVSGMGNQNATLTVASGAGLEMFSTVNELTKNMVFTGNGTSNSIQIGSGTPNAINGTMTIAGTNVWSVASGAAVRIDSSIANGASAGSILLTGGGSAQITGSSGPVTYTGSTIVSQGTLQLSTDNTATGGTLSNSAASTLLTGGGTVNYNGPVINNGLLGPGGTNGGTGTFNVGSLTLGSNNTVAFDIGSSSDLINAQTNLTIQSNTTFTINPSINHVNVGVYPLINYAVSGFGAEAGTTNTVTVTNPLPGYVFGLTNDATAKSIELVVVHVPAQLQWTGANATNHNLWDLAVTTNFVNQSSQPSAFSTGDSVTFGDGATSYQVTVGTNGPAGGSLTPVLVQFLNGTANPYTLSGKGYLTGPMQLQVSSGGTAIIANGGNSNNFTGGVIIQNGTLQLGNNDTNGTIGTGGITNFSTIQFNRTDTNILSNFYAGTSGGGFINQIGTGTTALIGNLTNMYGNIDITHGTLRLGSTTANSPTNLANIFVASGGALELSNSVNLLQVPITAAGSGPSGLGAIVNTSTNSSFSQANFAVVIATNDLTVGGNGRLDWRDPSGTNTQATFNTSGNAYNFTKAGSNQVQMTGVQFDSAIANITVQGGILGLQGLVSGSLGDTTKTLTVWSNATLQLFNTSNAFTKPLVLSGGTTNAATLNNNAGSNFWSATVALTGSNIFNIGGTYLQIDGVISGSGTLAKSGGSPLFLSQVETYTGPTYVTAGTLVLTNNGGGDASIASSSSINLGGGTIDVSSLSTQTLNIPSPQLLAGNGTIDGSLQMNPGASLIVGSLTSTGVLGVTNVATLAGSTTVSISASPKSNSALRTSNTVAALTYGGTLTVTNVSGNLKPGQSFQIFRSASSNYTGSFSSTTLPTLAPGLSWSNALATSGTITVVGTLTPPTISSAMFSGTTLSISGASGIPNGTFVLLSSSNIALPLAQWTKLSTNTFGGLGGFSLSVTNATNAQSYFIISE